MARIYEGMYLLDNAAVREDWNAAKSIVTGTLEKHGAKVLTARRWGERRLAYPINKRNRATFLLTYFEIPPDSFPGLRRDFELNEAVLRSLELRVDAIPEGEDELNQVEQADRQLAREPRQLPVMHLDPEVRSVFDFRCEHFRLEGYKPHRRIRAPIAV